MMKQLQEDRMEAAFHFICSYQKKEGISPTIREVQEYLGVSSTSTAYDVIKKLSEQGRVNKKRGCPRTLTIKGRLSLR